MNNKITLNGKEYDFKFTLKVVKALKKKFNKPVIELLQNPGMEEMAELIYYGIGGEATMPYEDFETKIDMFELTNVMGTVMKAINPNTGGKKK